MAQKDIYYGCFGVVKGKMNPKKERVWEIKAQTVEGAIRSLKSSAQSNYRDYHKEATLFDERGNVVGWAFSNYGQMIFVGKYLLQDIGLIPKSRK
jgi:hypothetical protein